MKYTLIFASLVTITLIDVHGLKIFVTNNSDKTVSVALGQSSQPTSAAIYNGTSLIRLEPHVRKNLITALKSYGSPFKQQRQLCQNITGSSTGAYVYILLRGEFQDELQICPADKEFINRTYA